MSETVALIRPPEFGDAPEASLELSRLVFDRTLDAVPGFHALVTAIIGELGFDAAWTRPDPQVAWRVGYRYAICYFSYDPSKNWSPAYIAACKAAGLEMGFVWETTAARTGAGFDAGVQDAREANRQADVVGVPQGVALYYATDFDASADQVRPYYQGVNSVGLRPVGAYGGIRVVDPLKSEGTIRFGWQTVAWSGGRMSSIADLYQRLTPTVPNPGGNYDEDVALHANWGQWIPGVTPAPIPVPAPVPTPAPTPSPGPVVIKPGQPAPPYPLPSTDWYGTVNPSPHNHSGVYNRADRPGIATFQAHLLWRGWSLSADGVYGPQTAGVVSAFQSQAGVNADGRVGPQTWPLIWERPITRP